MTADPNPQPLAYMRGPDQRVDPIPDRLEAAYRYAVKSQTHLWVATIVHRVGDTGLDQLDGKSDGDLAHLDAESMLLMPLIGCYVCEESYRPAMRRRRCPGEPPMGVKR